MERARTRRGGRRGFTLMELLVVLGILVLLMAIVTPKIIGVMGESRVKVARTQIGAFKGALEHYEVDMDTFPTTEQSLEALVKNPAETDGGASTRWDGPYTDSEELPKDPWGNDYQYAYPPVQGTGKYPDVWSMGPDGEDGTEDDIVSWKKETLEGEDDLEKLDEDLDRDLEPPPET